MMWGAGVLASLGSITYPAISAFVSVHSDPDQQGRVFFRNGMVFGINRTYISSGVAQGMVTGMRGLCNGLGPAMFGVIFYLFHVDLNVDHTLTPGHAGEHLRPPPPANATPVHLRPDEIPGVPGPPFVFGAFLVVIAILVAIFFLPEEPMDDPIRRPSGTLKSSKNERGSVLSSNCSESRNMNAFA